MPNEPIKINRVKGVDNVAPGNDFESPQVALNVDILSKEASIRSGYTKVASLTGCHSVFSAKSYLLCAAQGVGLKSLYSIQKSGQAKELGSLSETSDSLHYVRIADKVYLSSPADRKIFDLKDESLSDWGVDIPQDGPDAVSVTGGGLPAGRYALCFTNRNAKGEFSGQGPITYVEVPDSGSIQISNTSGRDVWITGLGDTNFYHAGVVSQISFIESVTVLQSKDVMPPPYPLYLAHFMGRIWGASGSEVVYSDAFAYSWFRDDQFFPFDAEVVMIAVGSQNEGLYIGTKESVWFITGESVRTMKTVRIGVGVIAGTLTYTDFAELGKKIPTWAGIDGIYAGRGGQVIKLTENKLRYPAGNRGAAFTRLTSGEPQYVASFEQNNATFGDEVTIDVIRNGRLVSPVWDIDIYDSLRLSDEAGEDENVYDGVSFTDTVTDTLL